MATSDTSGERPLKRQKLEDPRVLLKDLPANEFQKKVALYSGPMITITVREREFMLSQPLLSYYTSFFDEDLKSPIKEGEIRQLVFDGCSSETFQLVHQWIYSSQINIPTRQSAVQDVPINCSQNSTNSSTKAKTRATTSEAHEDTPASSRQSSAIPTDTDADAAFLTWAQEEDVKIELLPGIETNENAQSVSRLLAFLKLAHDIELLGPFSSVVEEIRATITSFRSALLPGHIRVAAVFSSGHPVRTLIAEACTRAFASYSFPRLVDGKKAATFRFEKELDELDGFAADLIREYTKASKKKVVSTKKDTPPEYWCIDPLTSCWFRLPTN
ncbi:hypothetical protein VTL71DRAFT_4193 [Oculimacula yallundae]|uniref:BTB domain-containing protein n=1 Tax=Oculimacula yallundae TaxID=86028 RepID=A0ABR4C549_9HELO